MNCECFYIVKDGTRDAARDLAKQIADTADAKGMELYPVCISLAVSDFKATSDYDNEGRSFTVKAGDWLVFVQGKYHCMCEIRPKGGKRGFPNMVIHDDFYDHFPDYAVDMENI